MDKLKQWVTFTCLGMVAVLAAGWFLLVSPKHQEAAETREQAAAQRDTNAALATQLQVLEAKAEQLPAKQAALAAVTAKIPTGPSLPTLVRALTAAADAGGVQLVSITPGPPTLPAAPAPVPVPATPDAAAGAPAAPAPAAPAPVAPAVVDPAAPVAAGAAGSLAAIPIGINVVGNYYEVSQFVAELEELPRALRLTGLTVTTGTSTATKSAPGTRTLAATLTGTVFMATGGTPTPAAPAVASPTS